MANRPTPILLHFFLRLLRLFAAPSLNFSPLRQLAAACCVLHPLAAVAQEKPPPEPPRGLRLLCVAADQPVRLLVAEPGEKGWLPRWRITLAAANLGDPIAIKGKEFALALDASPAPATPPPPGLAARINGEVTPVVPFTQSTLPGAGSSVAVLVPTGDKDKPFRIRLLDADPGRFRAGQILVHNFTGETVLGTLGGNRLSLGPDQEVVAEAKADRQANMAQITLGLKSAENGGRPFCDTRWPAVVAYRRYLFVLPRPGQVPTVFVMPEYPPFR